jgi:RNA polymerase sigma-70 factor, ECF subfamily
MNQDQTPSEFSLEALQAGDRAEFARLVEAYSAPIYRLAIKMLANSQDAEDVLQETFIKALRHLDQFDGRARISTWLYRIAANEALMVLRKRKRPVVSIDEPNEDDDSEQEAMQIVDWCCMPEIELMSTEAQHYLNQAVTGLSDSLRVVFVLRDMQGLSTEETARVLDLSETAVKTRLSRARLQLRNQLSNYYGERASHLSKGG